MPVLYYKDRIFRGTRAELTAHIGAPAKQPSNEKLVILLQEKNYLCDFSGGYEILAVFMKKRNKWIEQADNYDVRYQDHTSITDANKKGNWLYVEFTSTKGCETKQIAVVK